MHANKELVKNEKRSLVLNCNCDLKLWCVIPKHSWYYLSSIFTMLLSCFDIIVIYHSLLDCCKYSTSVVYICLGLQIHHICLNCQSLLGAVSFMWRKHAHMPHCSCLVNMIHSLFKASCVCQAIDPPLVPDWFHKQDVPQHTLCSDRKFCIL